MINESDKTQGVNLTKLNELLKQIDNADLGWFYGWIKDALRAVVELHKPFDFKLGDEMFTSCEGCGEAEYPCPTIQAIEKELE